MIAYPFIIETPILHKQRKILICLIKHLNIFELLGPSELLSENKTEKSDNNKEIESKEFDESNVAEILANLNEELAVKNRYRKKIIKILKIVLIVIVVLISIPILYSLFWMYIAATM